LNHRRGAGDPLSAADLSPPEDLVKLQLQPDVQPFLQNPIGKLTGRQLIPDRRKKHSETTGQALLVDARPGPLEVGPIADHELDLVVGPQVGEVFPQVFISHSAAGTLYVINKHCARIDGPDVAAPSSLNQNGLARVEQSADELMHRGLEKRLSPGYFNQVRRVAVHFMQDLLNGHLPPLMEGILGVAVGATEVAAGEPHENAGSPGIGGLALQAEEDLVHEEGIVHRQASNYSETLLSVARALTAVSDLCAKIPLLLWRYGEEMRVANVRLLAAVLCVLATAPAWIEAGVRREIERSYIERYLNKAMFLKVPVRGTRQQLLVRPSGMTIDRSNMSQPLTFRVGDQVRITRVNFRDASIHFTVAAIDMTREAEVVFAFPGSLGSDFPEQQSFDTALGDAFTEGISYTEIDSAKEQFIKDQYDDLIEHFASATGTSTDFVIRTISEKNPEYRAARAETERARTRAQQLEQELRDEKRARSTVDSELQTLRRELSQARNAAATTREEIQRLSDQRRNLEQQVRQLQSTNEEYERQVTSLWRSIGVDTRANADLGKRVEAASRNFETLRTERTGLTQKLDQVNKQVETLQNANKKLTDDLKASQDDNRKMSADIRTMTSDRNSLQARYLETRNRKDVLETAEALANALSVRKRTEKREGGSFLIGEVFLASRQIGVLETQVPSSSNQTIPVRFTLNSPDTVEFSEEERRLYQALGAKLTVETLWDTGSGELQAILGDSQSKQQVGPRDTATWSWSLQGDVPEPVTASLMYLITDANGQRIPLSIHDFAIYPSGTWAYIQRSFSWISLLAGVLVGLGVFALAFSFRGPRTPPARRQTTEPEYVAQKKLYD
jgi:predicted  nucleic acid-binding Zn-ribbon protein